MTQAAKLPKGSSPREWDEFWASPRGVTWKSRTSGLFEVIAGEFTGCPCVWEIGFGTTDFANLIGRDRWRGIDVSPIAVLIARLGGFAASESGLDVAPDDGVAAFQTLSYMDAVERGLTLDQMARARVAVITEIVGGHPEFRSAKQATKYLSAWWPDVVVTATRDGRKTVLLAVCKGKR